ncbi:hypothetical protein HFP89_08445 [Wenzhouxiangella sp. XN79A]|uniref:hypothetical protein n=1 Tax=Wenzhouxiangella sp. XN79A TaxID=2724193 RepID=UPI00144AE7FE|nr:hypothetical protein [Wenzhouxiangella sp. XN79A]NKI35194.1 hypothetical protein [Wenzhouxiangella sp. XN79A]
MSQPRPRPPEHVHLLRALASLALDYFRWTQLVPMLLAWTFLLFMVAALLLTNFQDASFSLLERGIGIYERVIGPIDGVAGPPAEAAGPDAGEPAYGEALRFSDEDIVPVVLRAWALLALVGWLFGVLRTMLFGPREPTGLAGKLRIAFYAAAGCSGLMWIAYGLGSETFHGSGFGWAMLFVGGPLLVWGISAWSLLIGQLVCRLQRRLHA